MLRYTLMFLLINSYGRSLGVPLREESSNGTKIIIGKLLSDLSKQCKNEFVLAQINSKMVTCNVEWNYQDVSTQCLMFYNANHALCNTTSVSAPDLMVDFDTKVTSKQNVTTFCSEVANITQPAGIEDREFIGSVLQSVVACTKVCAEEDVRSGQTNFFCKYYKWTLSKLDAAANLTHSQVPISTVKSIESANAAEEEDVPAVHASEATDGQNVPSDKVQTQSVHSHDLNNHPSEVTRPELSSPVLLTNIQTSSINKNTSVPLKVGEIAASGGQQPNFDRKPIGGGQANNAAPLSDIPANDFETQQHRGPLERGDDETGVDTDDDDRDDGLGAGGDDGGDPIINEPSLSNHQEIKDSENKLDTQSIFGEGSQKDFIQNTTGFTEDDDHFFPFFLTAVIFVVVLYILYHNKSKVGKLIFGLIVEGRQPGRRRNSRGHAYRRLDTLEQAMSANTTAPPSKIIY